MADGSRDVVAAFFAGVAALNMLRAADVRAQPDIEDPYDIGTVRKSLEASDSAMRDIWAEHDLTILRKGVKYWRNAEWGYAGGREFLRGEHAYENGSGGWKWYREAFAFDGKKLYTCAYDVGAGTGTVRKLGDD